MTLTDKYVYFRRIYGYGEGQLGFIKNIANIEGMAIILIFIKQYFPALSDAFLLLAPAIIGSYVLIGYIIGKLCDDKLKMVDRERAWENNRDPMLKDIVERLRRIEKQLI